MQARQLTLPLLTRVTFPPGHGRGSRAAHRCANSRSALAGGGAVPRNEGSSGCARQRQGGKVKECRPRGLLSIDVFIQFSRLII